MTKRPNSRRNLDIAIERLADDRSEALRLRRIFANTVVAQMMPAGAVKDGSAMRIRFGYAATRFSTDLDAARAEDLDAFVAEGDVDWAATREICERLFAYRRLHAWPSAVVAGERWAELYDEAREDLDVLPTVDEAVEWANKLIARIASS